MLLDVGLAIFILIFPFSPKIPLNIFGQPLLIRWDDIIVPILCLIWAIELLLKKRRFVYSKLYIPIGVYFLVGLISTLLGHYVKHTVPDLIYATCVILRSGEYYIVFFLTVNILKTKKQLMNYLNIWLIAAILISMYGIFDHLLNISGPTGLYDLGYFLGQSNHMGGYLMISLLLAIGLLGVAKTKLTKILSIIAIPLISYVTLFNLSRTTYFSTLAALFVFFILKNKKLIMIPILGATLLFLIIPNLFSNTVLGKRLNNITSDIFSLRIRPLDQFDSMALHRAKFVYIFRDFSKYFLLGSGLGVYPLCVYDSQLSLVPVTTGILGVIAFIWLLVEIFREVSRIYKSTSNIEVRSLVSVFMAIYFGVLVHSITSTAFMIALIAYPFWFLAGISIVCDKNLVHETR